MQLLGSYSSENFCEIFYGLGIFGMTRLSHATAHSRKPLSVIAQGTCCSAMKLPNRNDNFHDPPSGSTTKNPIPSNQFQGSHNIQSPTTACAILLLVNSRVGGIVKMPKRQTSHLGKTIPVSAPPTTRHKANVAFSKALCVAAKIQNYYLLLRAKNRFHQ